MRSTFSDFAVKAERKGVARKLTARGAGPAYPRPDLSREPGTETMEKIKHIVILMMENHSFDSYLGVIDRPDVDRFILDGDGRPVYTNRACDGAVVHLQHRANPVQLPHVPTQTWQGSHLQWNEGANDGFVTSQEEMLEGKHLERRTIGMQYWTIEELPFYYKLATTFPLADHWFSSCLGPTFPNRRFLIAGTAHGLIDDLPFGMLDNPKGGTLFDLLTLYKIDWVNYHSGTPLLRQLGRLLGPGRRAAWSLQVVLVHAFPRLVGWLMGKLQFTADLYPLKFWSVRNHIRSMKDFFTDAADGTLPPVSIVDPDFRATSEENPQDIQEGEAFASAVINAVMSGNGWPGTLLIWTYDEHGGYFDHSSPPSAPPPDDVLAHSILDAPTWLRWLLKALGQWKKIQRADEGPRTYDTYGFRVPAVIVSPYAKRDFVTHEVYDHTSILKFIERKWNLPALTARDFQATDFVEALDLTGDGPFLIPPELPKPNKTWSRVGTRKARLRRAFR